LKEPKDEPVDNFVTSLHCLSEHCKYGNFHNEMICDKIVVGLWDSASLQKPKEMTITFAHQIEKVKKQQQVIRADQTPSNTGAILTK